MEDIYFWSCLSLILIVTTILSILLSQFAFEGFLSCSWMPLDMDWKVHEFGDLIWLLNNKGMINPDTAMNVSLKLLTCSKFIWHENPRRVGWRGSVGQDDIQQHEKSEIKWLTEVMELRWQPHNKASCCCWYWIKFFYKAWDYNTAGEINITSNTPCVPPNR
jgi:hypothetical protein